VWRSADWVCVDSCWVELSSVRQLVIDAIDVPTALPDRHNTMAPGRYVLCAGIPDDPTDTAAWRALPVIAAGDGRRAHADVGPTAG
jgi:hypothetical protein